MGDDDLYESGLSHECLLFVGDLYPINSAARGRRVS